MKAPLDPTLENLVSFVRDFAGISPRKAISSETRLDTDLGITGDDGDAFLKDVAERFDAELATPHDGYRSTFGLGPNEYLFHSEGVSLFGVGPLLARLIRRGPDVPTTVRDLTVGELLSAVLRTKRATRAV